jgi:hypothetical protein
MFALGLVPDEKYIEGFVEGCLERPIRKMKPFWGLMGG